MTNSRAYMYIHGYHKLICILHIFPRFPLLFIKTRKYDGFKLFFNGIPSGTKVSKETVVFTLVVVMH